jgi:beta-lactam-binding protein with PASTA domain
LVIAFVVTVVGIYFAIRWTNSYTLHGITVEVPDLDGFHYTEVSSFLKGNQLESIIIDSVYDSQKQPGVVLDQDPKAFSKVKPGRKVYLTINSIVPPKVILPILNDLTLRQARSRVKMYGLDVDSLIYRPSECTNCIIGVLYNGKKAKPGLAIQKGHKITLIVGSGLGEEKVSIPYLYGKTLEEVEAYLVERGFNLGLIRNDETIVNKADSAKAIVYKQIPEFNEDSKIPLGKSIDVFLTTDNTKFREIELIESDTSNNAEEN